MNPEGVSDEDILAFRGLPIARNSLFLFFPVYCIERGKC
jgi:hypothetical protein